MKALNIKPKDYKLFEFEKRAYTNLMRLRSANKLKIKKNSRHFKNWYRENRKDINYYFSDIMNGMDDLGIIKKNIKIQKIYDQFVDFVFKNSHINI